MAAGKHRGAAAAQQRLSVTDRVTSTSSKISMLCPARREARRTTPMVGPNETHGHAAVRRAARATGHALSMALSRSTAARNRNGRTSRPRRAALRNSSLRPDRTRPGLSVDQSVDAIRKRKCAHRTIMAVNQCTSAFEFRPLWEDEMTRCITESEIRRDGVSRKKSWRDSSASPPPVEVPRWLLVSFYSGFTHNPHHLILDSVIDPKGYRGEHLFWIHTQSPPPDFGLSGMLVRHSAWHVRLFSPKKPWPTCDDLAVREKKTGFTRVQENLVHCWYSSAYTCAKF